MVEHENTCDTGTTCAEYVYTMSALRGIQRTQAITKTSLRLGNCRRKKVVDRNLETPCRGSMYGKTNAIVIGNTRVGRTLAVGEVNAFGNGEGHRQTE